MHALLLDAVYELGDRLPAVQHVLRVAYHFVCLRGQRDRPNQKRVARGAQSTCRVGAKQV